MNRRVFGRDAQVPGNGRIITVENMNLLAGWIGVLAGVLSGAFIGLFFHRNDWLGGYDTFSRRLIRLGHISFFGIAFLNFSLALTFRSITLSPGHALVASNAMVLGAVTMPMLCFLTAWRRKFRHLFFIPVISILLAAMAVIAGWP
jgi:hypothetical protein